MKKSILILVLILLSACGKKVSSTELQMKGQTYYFVNSEKLFSGTFIETYPNGKKSGKYKVKNGKLNGKQVMYFPSKIFFLPGNIQSEFKFKDGVPDGTVSNYYDPWFTFFRKYREIRKYDNGKPVGEWKSYYNNGSFFSRHGSISQIGTFKDGFPDGDFISYDKNGEVSAQLHYNNGKLDGDYTSYYENGQIAEKFHYTNGKVDGDYIKYFENGQKLSYRKYKNGLLTGKIIYYYPNNMILRELSYSNGKINGIYKEYFENGSPMIEAKYKEGLIDDYIKLYDEEKYIIFNLEMKNDEVIHTSKQIPLQGDAVEDYQVSMYNAQVGVSERTQWQDEDKFLREFKESIKKLDFNENDYLNVEKSINFENAQEFWENVGKL